MPVLDGSFSPANAQRASCCFDTPSGSSTNLPVVCYPRPARHLREATLSLIRERERSGIVVIASHGDIVPRFTATRE